MFRVVKKYSIQFGHAGTLQYCIVRENEKGEFRGSYDVNYGRVDEGKKFDIEKMKSIDEVIEAINEDLSNREYGRPNAELISINNEPLMYYENKEVKEYVKELEDEFDDYLKYKMSYFLHKFVKPVLEENNLYLSISPYGVGVIIHKNEDGEWDNYNDKKITEYIEYMCSQFYPGMTSNGIEDRYPDDYNEYFTSDSLCGMINTLLGETSLIPRFKSREELDLDD